jgi:isoleucyl-tRNA synthetase
LNFSEKGVDEARKKVIMRLRNVLAFYRMYTNESSVISSQSSDNILDKWILARLKSLAREITEKLDNYELDKAARPIADFVDDLSTWYIRRSRSRFKEEGEDKNNAINTARFALMEFSKLIAPFTPFISEEIYQELNKEKESVHLDDWPEIKKLTKEEEKILEEMENARKIVSLALEERAKAGIKIRQPLKSLKIKNLKLKISDELLNLIKDEVNVKEIIFDKRIENEVEIDTAISDDLREEGIIRELSRRIQDLRKKAGLMPRQKIELIIETDSNREKLIKQFENEIKKGTNTTAIEFSKNDGGEIKIDELMFKISIRK